ncbi:MAG TPA: hypothetical protein VLF42_06215 [Burkholderiales bacterium]|nr:hypothetical protein [Burkholderiales bacterium]
MPDGTRVYPFLNPADSTNDLPPELSPGASVALGEVRPGHASKIHMHPFVTMIVWVMSGRLSLRLKDKQSRTPYTLRLRAGEGALALPGTFLQLLNGSRTSCRVLYIASPAYVFLKVKRKILYDDAIVVDAGWDELARLRWRAATASTLAALRAARVRALRRLRTLKRKRLLSPPSRSRGRRARSGS